MFAFSCFVFACRNFRLGLLLIICSLNTSYFYQSKNVTSVLVVIVLENGV